jgi:hypothetical protein
MNPVLDCRQDAQGSIACAPAALSSPPPTDTIHRNISPETSNRNARPLIPMGCADSFYGPVRLRLKPFHTADREVDAAIVRDVTAGGARDPPSRSVRRQRRAWRGGPSSPMPGPFAPGCTARSTRPMRSVTLLHGSRIRKRFSRRAGLASPAIQVVAFRAPTRVAGHRSSDGLIRFEQIIIAPALSFR